MAENKLSKNQQKKQKQKKLQREKQKKQKRQERKDQQRDNASGTPGNDAAGPNKKRPGGMEGLSKRAKKRLRQEQNLKQMLQPQGSAPAATQPPPASTQKSSEHKQNKNRKVSPQVTNSTSKKQTKSPVTGKKPQGKKLTSLQKKMQGKIQGAQFRFLNEQLYTTTGKQAFTQFQKEPELFDVYHAGFRQQVIGWPVNPLDQIIGWLQVCCITHTNTHTHAHKPFITHLFLCTHGTRRTNTCTSFPAFYLPQKQPKKLIVADMGCGEARLAQTICKQHTVHSFDLVSPNEFVTACDMAHTPLKSASVNVVVMCLALMGTTLADFVREARRIMVDDGVLKIVEVRSRLEADDKVSIKLS
jgi:ribosomal RNA-processing protein 8